jgi:hypothetical protein
MRMELHRQAIGITAERRIRPCCLIVFSVTSITFSNENNRYCLHRREGRGCLRISPVADRKRQTEWRKTMKMSLASTAIALTMIVTSAHAGQLPNGYSINGLALNGVQANGLWQNGLWSNGIWQNGVWQNGVYENGLAMNGRTSTGPHPDAFAGSQAIGSADLIAIELPR